MSKELRRFILAGGSLNFSDWEVLSEEEKLEVELAYAERLKLSMISLTFLLFPYDDEYKMNLSKLMSEHDGSKLEKFNKIIEFHRGVM